MQNPNFELKVFEMWFSQQNPLFLPHPDQLASPAQPQHILIRVKSEGSVHMTPDRVHELPIILCRSVSTVTRALT